MLDFLRVTHRPGKRGVTEIYPKFVITRSKDLMIRGSDFYAVWLEDRGLWSTDEQDVLQLIDRELNAYAEEHKEMFESFRVLHMWDAESGMNSPKWFSASPIRPGISSCSTEVSSLSKASFPSA